MVKAQQAEHNGLTLEALSTDYQRFTGLADLVDAHCLFLKFGPELTFNFREAVLALSAIENRFDFKPASHIKDVLLEKMNADPQHWKPYYKAPVPTLSLLKLFSYSDRIRYYWPRRSVRDALALLITDLAVPPVIEGLYSQHFAAEQKSCGS